MNKYQEALDTLTTYLDDYDAFSLKDCIESLQQLVDWTKIDCSSVWKNPRRMTMEEIYAYFENENDRISFMNGIVKYNRKLIDENNELKKKLKGKQRE